MAVPDRIAVLAAAASLAVGPACAPRRALCPPALAPSQADVPSERTLMLGEASLEIHAATDEDAPVSGLILTVACPGANDDVHSVRTDAAGVAVVEGLPNAQCIVRTPTERTVTLGLTAGRRTTITVNEPIPPAVGPRRPSGALPSDVLLRLEASACLGNCRPYVAMLHEDGRVTVQRDDGERQWRLSDEAQAQATSRARCLARGPSYPEATLSDGQRHELWVRDDGGIATYRLAADVRAPSGHDRYIEDLEITLRLRRRWPT